MAKITCDVIQRMNELYFKYKTFAAVARELNVSAATVSKYVDRNYRPVSASDIKKFDTRQDFREIPLELFNGVDNFGTLCTLSDIEKNEIRDLWKELTL